MHDTNPHSSHAALRALPSIDQLLRAPMIASLLEERPRREVVCALREILEEQRARIQRGESACTDPQSLALALREQLYRRTRPTLRKAINATGVVLHTGLGRAPLANEAIEAISQVAAGYCNLEYDLESGERGDRQDHLRSLLRELTGAEEALVVNNNAAATWLALNTLAAGGEVVVSRGQLVEIGGSYRLPEIMRAAQCRLVEIGTTNRTHLRDYAAAISPATAALLRVHTSNYRIEGFVAQPALPELVALAHAQDLPLIDDLGSGWFALEGQEPFADEPAVGASLAAGADVVLFSGDKLLGGPQAGVIVGRAPLLERMQRNALMRAMRPDKLALAALEATLRLLAGGPEAASRIPARALLTKPLAALREAAERLARQISSASAAFSVRVEAGHSAVGGGSLPGVSLETWLVAIRHADLDARRLAAALRERELPIIARVHRDELLLDPRTIFDDELDAIAPALAQISATAAM